MLLRVILTKGDNVVEFFLVEINKELSSLNCKQS